MSAGLSLSEVSVVLGGRAILDRISLTVDSGTWVGLIGPNGAGKTTTLRCIRDAVGFEGTVTIGGRPIGGAGGEGDPRSDIAHR